MTKSAIKGFTIIEVVLVLAIAGLIFLMVFIALPALNRGQRDTQRRNDASTFMTQVNQYSTNNRGNTPGAETINGANGFLVNYMKQKADNSGEFRDPKTGENYIVAISGALASDPGSMLYSTSQKCNGESSVSAGSRSATLLVRLEGSGVFCVDNQGQ